MTRSSAPPSGERQQRRPARRGCPGSAGSAIFWLLGRLTQSWTPWNSPPLTTSASGGVSMCRMPPPAVIHWVSPSVITPPPPLESWCSKIAVDHVGDGLEAAVRVPRRALGLARRVVDLAHLVHVDERVEVGQVDAGEGPADGEALALEAARRRGDARDRAVGRDRPGRARAAGQREDVLDGHSRHVHLRAEIEFSIAGVARPGSTVFLASRGGRRSGHDPYAAGVTHPADVLAADAPLRPAKPRVTFYEDTPGPTRGERIELSAPGCWPTGSTRPPTPSRRSGTSHPGPACASTCPRTGARSTGRWPRGRSGAHGRPRATAADLARHRRPRCAAARDSPRRPRHPGRAGPHGRRPGRPAASWTRPGAATYADQFAAWDEPADERHRPESSGGERHGIRRVVVPHATRGERRHRHARPSTAELPRRLPGRVGGDGSVVLVAARRRRTFSRSAAPRRASRGSRTSSDGCSSRWPSR